MKIAIVDHPWSKAVPPVQSGSISIWTWEVARRLARRHNVLVYEGGGDFLRPRIHHCENVEYRMQWIGADDRIVKLRQRLRIKESVRRPYAAAGSYYLAYSIQAALDIRRQGCDVVHVHQFSQIVPTIRKFNPRTKIVLHMNCEWLTQFDRDLVRPRVDQSDLIIGCSDHITNLIRARFPDVGERCRTVYNGVNVDKFIPQGEAPEESREVTRLLFAGRVSPEKGVHDLIDAFKIVARHRPDVELDIVGPEWPVPKEWLVGLSEDPTVAQLAQFYDGSYRSHLEKRITPEVRDRIHFIGGVPNDDLVGRYREADVLINPSLSESFGMTVAEAMACGKPVIVTRVGGMTETVVQGENGFTVSPADPAALAEAILHTLSAGEEVRNRMGRVGRKRALELYSWDRVANSLLEAYAGVQGKPAMAVQTA